MRLKFSLDGLKRNNGGKKRELKNSLKETRERRQLSSVRCEFRCFHDVLNSLVCRDSEYVSTALQWHAPRFGGIVVISKERRKYAALFSRFCTAIGKKTRLLQIFSVSRLVHNFQKSETQTRIQ